MQPLIEAEAWRWALRTWSVADVVDEAGDQLGRRG